MQWFKGHNKAGKCNIFHWISTIFDLSKEHVPQTWFNKDTVKRNNKTCMIPHRWSVKYKQVKEENLCPKSITKIYLAARNKLNEIVVQ